MRKFLRKKEKFEVYWFEDPFYQVLFCVAIFMLSVLAGYWLVDFFAVRFLPNCFFG